MSSFSFDPDAGVCYRTLDFLGFLGYRVGDDGTVWSRRSPNGKTGFTKSWRRLSCTERPDGYLTLALRKNDKTYGFLVHHLILMSFWGPRPNGMECLHADDVKSNNNLSNLAWGTHVKNCEQRNANGGQRKTKVKKELVAQVLQFISVNKCTIAYASRVFGVSDSQVSRMVRGELIGV